MAIQPLDDRIIVQPDIADDRTASGIYLPEGAKEKPMTGKVVVTGPGTLSDDGSRAKVCVKKGDKVFIEAEPIARKLTSKIQSNFHPGEMESLRTALLKIISNLEES